MERKIEDLEKSMKRSNDKQLKIEHECCLRVYVQPLFLYLLIYYLFFKRALLLFVSYIFSFFVSLILPSSMCLLVLSVIAYILQFLLFTVLAHFF